MFRSANIELARRVYAANGDPAAITEAMAPEVIWDVAPGFLRGGVYKGADSIRNDFFGQLARLFDSFCVQGEEFFGDDDNHVFVYGHYHATKGRGIAVARFIHLWTIRDGQLIRMQEASDSLILDRLAQSSEELAGGRPKRRRGSRPQPAGVPGQPPSNGVTDPPAGRGR